MRARVDRLLIGMTFVVATVLLNCAAANEPATRDVATTAETLLMIEPTATATRGKACRTLAAAPRMLHAATRDPHPRTSHPTRSERAAQRLLAAHLRR